MASFEILDHTGDIGIRVTALSREELFKSAAAAMLRLMVQPAVASGKISKNISVTGDDDEQLLVNWLSEINFYFQTEQFLTSHISSFGIRKDELSATVRGDTIDLSVQPVLMDIKAVTYHKIYIKTENGLWSAQIIFDV